MTSPTQSDKEKFANRLKPWQEVQSDKTVEELIQERLKVIGDGEWTLLGVPADLVAALTAREERIQLELLDRLAEQTTFIAMNADGADSWGVIPADALIVERGRLNPPEPQQ